MQTGSSIAVPYYTHVQVISDYTVFSVHDSPIAACPRSMLRGWGRQPFLLLAQHSVSRDQVVLRGEKRSRKQQKSLLTPSLQGI